MKVTSDHSGHDPEESAPRVLENAPKGTYPARIHECDVTQPEGKDRRIEVSVEITDPANKYWRLKEYLNLESPKVVWRVDQFLMAVGVLSKTKRKASWDPATLVNRPVTIIVGEETSTYTPPGETTPRTGTRPRVNAWLPKGAKAPTAAESNGDSADEEISLEMHGAAADEGDDESIAYLTEKAEEHEVDWENIDTWAEVATEIQNIEGQEEEEEPEDEEGDDLDALGAAGDEEDEDAQARLEELAGEAELDPNDYPTWAELAEALGKADASQDEAEDDEVPDYGSQTLAWLKKEAKEREIQLKGTETRKEITAKLEKWDEDPFDQ